MQAAPAIEQLRQSVLAAVCKHWVVPRRADQVEPVPPEKIEATAHTVLDTMLTRQFRVGPLPPGEVYDQMLERVRRKVRRNQPIYVTIGYGPLKNQHAVSYSRADWAEFFALGHLASWHNKVQAVYAPGLQLRIVFDDSTLSMANHADRRLMKSYMASVDALIRVLGYDRLFLPCFGHSWFAWVFHLGLYQLARWRVRRWERDPANQAQIEKMREFARRNLVLPAELNHDQQENYIRQASHRYRVYWEALQRSGLTRSKGKLIAMYLDGSQHHVPQAVALHLTSVDKGQVTQPWQGEGVLLDNGHGGLEPFVLTAGRRSRYQLQNVDGLSVLPCPGFEAIGVVRPTSSAESTATSCT